MAALLAATGALLAATGALLLGAGAALVAAVAAPGLLLPAELDDGLAVFELEEQAVANAAVAAKTVR